MRSKKSAIVEYYDTCEGDYRIFWDLDRSLAMHAGYWDSETKTLADALKRENEILAELAGVTSSDYVLDAGCGVGGSSIFLAEQYRCRVKGITLSGRQVETASENAEVRRVDRLVSFEMMDFCRTSFTDETFDVVWGLESVCHASDKRIFLQEAYRLLKKGGRLVIADGFATKEIYEEPERWKMKKWLFGWGVEAIDSIEVFEQSLKDCGFKDIVFHDITMNVMPSSRRLYWISFPASVLSKCGEWLGVRNSMQTDNIKAAYYQHTTLKSGLWRYGIFTATK